jgi:ribosomal protein S27E
MSRRSLVTCPGSGTNSGLVFSTSNPKTNCPRCGKRVEVHHGGKIRKHMAMVTTKGRVR